jgi:hypothetical protein
VLVAAKKMRTWFWPLDVQKPPENDSSTSDFCPTSFRLATAEEF